MEFETVIGLEIHAELCTAAKAFCNCLSSFGSKANTNCCPVCIGMPGALPVLNKKVLEYGVKLAIALNCEIPNVSRFVRKHYFYPDLPKGYQISQLNEPVAVKGELCLLGKKIRINRIQIEEDAGKLIHDGETSKIDHNRAGVPLLEIVTEPDFRSGEEVKSFLEELRLILMYLGICKCKMEEGNLRFDVNVSVRYVGEDKYNPRCEIKNVNSFTDVYNAVEYERKRQMELMEKGEKAVRESRKWDSGKNISIVMRSKEANDDYRYFPEENIPGAVVTKEYIEDIRINMPELPEAKRDRYTDKYFLPECVSELIVRRREFARLFEEAAECGANPKKAANWILEDISKILNEKKTDIPFGGRELAELISLLDEKRISQSSGKAVLEKMFTGEGSPKEIVEREQLEQIFDEKVIDNIVNGVIEENPKSLSDYKKGKTNAFGYLMGQCMKKGRGRLDAKLLEKILKKKVDT